jgi:hypothetical protein
VSWERHQIFCNESFAVATQRVAEDGLLQLEYHNFRDWAIWKREPESLWGRWFLTSKQGHLFVMRTSKSKSLPDRPFSHFSCVKK